MNRFLTAAVIAAVLILGIVVGVIRRDEGTLPEERGNETLSIGTTECRRVVSMAPNITETLLALGLGDRVVGVTRFCTYPPEALGKQSVGGYLDPNYEIIASLRPDMVFLLPEQENVRTMLGELDIHTETVRNRTVAEILETIRYIGARCGAGREAGLLIADIEKRIETVRARTAGVMSPRVLISVSRDYDVSGVQRMYAAGPNTFFDELIGDAGGRNAYKGPAIAYPVLSMEGIISLNPDVIIDLVPPDQAVKTNKMQLAEAWASLGDVTAVRSGRVYVIDADYATVPGPRFISFLEDLTDIIHDREE
ncbi:ABC transporter substrate-binding protein [Candidatus Latescibacterota bacterium]